MTLKQQLGLRIKELRKKNKLTQAQLAEKVNIATKHESCIETGKNYPSAELIEKYAKVFNLEPAEVLRIPFKLSKSQLIQNIIKHLTTLAQEDIYKIYAIMDILNLQEEVLCEK